MVNTPHKHLRVFSDWTHVLWFDYMFLPDSTSNGNERRSLNVLFPYNMTISVILLILVGELHFVLTSFSCLELGGGLADSNHDQAHSHLDLLSFSDLDFNPT